MSQYDDMPIYVERNKKLFDKVLVPAVYASIWQAGFGRTNPDELFVQEMAHRMYDELRKKWPQLNEKTEVYDIAPDSTQRETVFLFHAIRGEPQVVTLAQLNPGLIAALARAAAPFVMRLYVRTKLRFLSLYRLNGTLLKRGSRMEQLTFPPPTYSEVFSLEHFALTMKLGGMGYHFDDTMLIHFRGFYVPRFDRMYYIKLWADYIPPGDAIDPMWYVQPDPKPAYYVITKPIEKLLDEVLKNFDETDPNVKATDIKLLSGDIVDPDFQPTEPPDYKGQNQEHESDDEQ